MSGIIKIIIDSICAAFTFVLGVIETAKYKKMRKFILIVFSIIITAIILIVL